MSSKRTGRLLIVAAQAPYLIGLGVVQMGIPYILFARALRSVASHEAAG